MALARDGAGIVLTGRRPGPLEEVAGRIRAAGGTAHVQPGDLTEPDAVRIVITKEGVFAGGKRVAGGADDTAKFSPLPMLEGLNEIFAGVSEQTAKSFDVTLLDRERLRLKPRSQRLADWVASIEITLGPAPRVPVHVKLDEPSGDSTEITFRDLEVNPKLDDAAFAP